jgi:hypothetical protein
LIADIRKPSIGGYFLIGSLLSLLAGVIAFGRVAWALGEGTDVPAFGYVAMGAGILFWIVLGVGLMGLCFCSSRLGYDKPAKFVRRAKREKVQKDSS